MPTSASHWLNCPQKTAVMKLRIVIMPDVPIRNPTFPNKNEEKILLVRMPFWGMEVITYRDGRFAVFDYIIWSRDERDVEKACEDTIKAHIRCPCHDKTADDEAKRRNSL